MSFAGFASKKFEIWQFQKHRRKKKHEEETIEVQSQGDSEPGEKILNRTLHQ
jgi:hypothetical protein